MKQCLLSQYFLSFVKETGFFCRVLWVDVMIKYVDSGVKLLGLNPALSLLQENEESDKTTHSYDCFER